MVLLLTYGVPVTFLPSLHRHPGRFRDAVSWDTITVSAVDSEDRVSTYRLPAQVEVRGHGASGAGGARDGPGQPGTQGRRGSRMEPGKDGGRKDGDIYLDLSSRAARLGKKS